LTESILYFILTIFIAAFVAVWLYYSNKTTTTRQSFILLLLRFLSFVALLLLVINPKWQRTKLSLEKPRLVVAFDNSASIVSNKSSALVRSLETTFKNHALLNKKFAVSYYSFGSSVQALDSLDFSESQTNIAELVKQVEALNPRKKTPIVLISDGNQTIGSSYEYLSSTNPIYPIVVGDTTAYFDLKIDQLNHNQYAFLDNTFPVEVFALYKGDKQVSSRLEIFRNRQRVYSKNLVFDPQSKSQKIAIQLKADKVGRHFYTASLRALKDEKNKANNTYDFSVEVIDQQTKVLLVSTFLHPDLGAIKKSIEANKQRKVTIQLGLSKDIKLSDYQLVILYQPSQILRPVFNQIKELNLNTFIITGSKTDWVFLNSIQNGFSKKSTKQLEDFQAIYNPSFNEFVTQDIGFKDYPPLKGVYGEIEFKVPYQSLIFQKIGSVDLEEPLVAAYSVNHTNNIVLFGEGIWRWRMNAMIANQSNKPFDSFFNTLIQYTATSKHEQQLHLTYEKLAYNNENYQIKASYVDKNYQVDKQASLLLYLTNEEDNSVSEHPFYLENNEYLVNLANLNPAAYSFQVRVTQNDIKSYGSFKVLDYSIEQQFTTADNEKLQKLATQSGGSLSYADNPERVIQKLIDDPQFQTFQKSKKISTALIDFRWLLAFIVVSLSAEWFIRKYKGLI